TATPTPTPTATPTPTPTATPTPTPTPAPTATPTPTPTPTPTATPTPTPTPTPAPTPTPGGPQFFVSTPGSPTNNGSINSPWDLQTALNQPSGVVAGSTIYVRGGIYVGKFVSSLTGTAASPITVRSYPGEWAKIDGYFTTTLSASINATQTTLTVADGSKFLPGRLLTFHDQATESAEELVWVSSRSGNTLSVQRAWGGTTALSHNAGALCVLGGNQLTVNGSDTIYRDFEITNSDPVRTWDIANGQASPHIRGVAVMHTGARTKLVNLVLHDCEN